MLTTSRPSRRAAPSVASSRGRRARQGVALHVVDRYARDVLDGTILAGPLVRAACARHQRDRRAKRWTFDAARADHALTFFERYLRLPDLVDVLGDPQPFRLQLWQAFIIGSLFGWVDRHGRRRFREAYIEVGKGNGKTPLAAGIGLYGLLMDGERAAEIYSAAVTQDQARILWRDAVNIIEGSPALARLCATKRLELQAANIAYRPAGAWFRPLSSEKRGLDGKRPHMGLIDELHEHPTPIVTVKIRAGAKGRTQPLFIEITNSGVDRTSICWQHHERSRRVVEGTVQAERWFAYVCGLDEGDDPLQDRRCWPKANPNLGVSIQPDYLEHQVETALQSPGETNTVLRLNFCVWTQAISRYFDAAKWQACGAVVADDALVGQPCFGGLDLGQSDDLSAFVLVWPLPDGRVVVRLRVWIPRVQVEASGPGRPYEQWLREGAVTITEGDVTDFDQVQADVLAACQRWGVREVAFDKRFASQLALHLEGAGVTMVDTPQGFQLNEPIVKLGELVAQGKLCHGGDPVLAWMADNFVVRTGRAGEKRPDKPAAKDKIDGIVALCMALDRVLRQPASEPVYVY